jgi:hypothetical protein
VLNIEEHSKFTFSKYGVRGEDIHTLMNEPSILWGLKHKHNRHIPNQSIPNSFIEKYGETLAKNIMIDHIILDQESENKDTGLKFLAFFQLLALLSF